MRIGAKEPKSSRLYRILAGTNSCSLISCTSHFFSDPLKQSYSSLSLPAPRWIALMRDFADCGRLEFEFYRLRCSLRY